MESTSDGGLGPAAAGPAVSIVLCTRGRDEETLRLCLGALSQQKLDDERVEIIVVDGNADNRVLRAMPEDLGEDGTAVIHIQSPGRQSMITARHAGITTAGGEFVAFIDDDCVAAPSWLHDMVRCARERRLDGLQGRTIGFARATFMEKFAVFDQSQMKPFRAADGRFFNISTVNALYRLQLLRAMDFHLRRTKLLESKGIFVGFEDYLMTQEALRLDAVLGYCETAVVEHMHPRTLRAKTRQFHHYGWNAYGYCWITKTDPAALPGYRVPSSPTLRACVRSWITNSPRLIPKFKLAAAGQWTVLEKLGFPIVCSVLELSYLLGARACARAIRNSDVRG
jgi:glycosyltransferase involved in cell wall biosynthesis